MDAEDFPKLIELLDKLSRKRTGRYLKNSEKTILQQLLIGKQQDKIECIKDDSNDEYDNEYIRKTLIPKLWDHLSKVFKKRIRQKNVLNELKKLQSQNQELKILSLIREIINRHIKLKGNTVASRSVLGKTKKISYLNFEGTSQNTARLNTPSAYSTQLTLNGQQFTTSPDAEEQKFEDDAPEQTQPKFHDHSYQVVTTDKTRSTNSTYGWHLHMRLSKAGLPLLIAAGVLGSCFGLSWLANWYGVKSRLAGNLPHAELSYKIALKLFPFSPFSAPTHYNLGELYEEQQNYQQAKAQYQLAIEGGLIDAYNNQARLYILTKNYDAAIGLLRVAIPLEKDQNDLYSMFKNRGWARLEQGRLEEADQALKEAIALRSDRAPAYCLLAQVLERQGEKTEAISQWGNCLDYAYQSQSPEEDKWINLAQQRLKAEEGDGK
ncbi:MAG: tetratricopeptide repeat protein [Gloeocapsa sp. UFS-A4-WI-NPMV-4B04]|nr:tetratricopeptide repeat protein [Gloeocapsa sp. UFS-A4-WI-NPMV-4B04]